jgi:hypothetical protein
MRNSSWRITLDPFGSPRVLVDFGDLLEREINLDASQLYSVGSFDFAVSAAPSARGNRRRRMEIEKRVAHDTAAASWHEAAKQLAAGPWGGSAVVIQIQPVAGEPVLFRGALRSSPHGPSSDGGIAESLHEWAMSCTALPITAGEGINVGGGWYNPPGSGGGVTVIIPPGSGVTPGTVVKVENVPGVPDGYYSTGDVITGGGGSPGSPIGDAVKLLTPPTDEDQPNDGGFTADFSSPSIESPAGSTYLTSLHRSLVVTASVPYEALGADGDWYAFPPGTREFRSDTLFGARCLLGPSKVTGSWSGLTEETSPREITYSNTPVSFSCRIGLAIHTIQIARTASGHVSYGIAGGNQELPPASASIDFFGGFTPPAGSLAGGGTITPVTFEP